MDFSANHIGFVLASYGLSLVFIGGLILIERNEGLGAALLITSAVPLLHALFAGVVSRRGPLP